MGFNSGFKGLNFSSFKKVCWDSSRTPYIWGMKFLPRRIISLRYPWCDRNWYTLPYVAPNNATSYHTIPLLWTDLKILCVTKLRCNINLFCILLAYLFITFFTVSFGEMVSQISIVIRLRKGSWFSFLQGQRIFQSPWCPGGVWGPPSPLFSLYRLRFHRGV